MLEQNHFSLAKTAEQLKISRHALRYRMQRLNIAAGDRSGRGSGWPQRAKTIHHEHSLRPVWPTSRVKMCWPNGRAMSPATRERLIVFAAIALVTVPVLVWAVFFRKTRRRQHDTPSQSPSFTRSGREAAADGERRATTQPRKRRKWRRPRRDTPPAQPDTRRNGRLAAGAARASRRRPRALSHAREPDDHAEKRVESGAGFRAAAQSQTRRHVRPLRVLPRGG